jgi:hypothetical protein
MKVKLDDYTLTVLNSFSGINNSIVINAGNELRTMPESKTILAEAIVPTNFDKTFGIYDLRKFLGCLSLCINPEVEFFENYLEIYSQNGNSIKYVYTDPARIVTPATKRINIAQADIQFNLSSDTLKDVNKACGVLSVEDIMFSSSDRKIKVTVLDKNDPTSNSASFDVEGETNETFVAYIKNTNMKLIPGDYEVFLSSRGISLFESKTNKGLKYYIAVESDSSF